MLVPGFARKRIDLELTTFCELRLVGGEILSGMILFDRAVSGEIGGDD